METQEKRQSDTGATVCKNCGAEMQYDPEHGCLICSYCDTHAQIDAQRRAAEKTAFDAGANAGPSCGGQTRAVECKNCGAQIVLAADKAADCCVFCGSPVVDRLDDADAMTPDTIIPFKVSDRKAAQSFGDWIRHRRFAPRKLKKVAQMQRLSGVYIPHFAFDVDTVSQYSATVSKGEDKKVKVSGEYTRKFQNIVVPASAHVDKRIEGDFKFALGETLEYKPEFLSGFSAERVSVKSEDGYKDARGEIDRQIGEGVRNKVNSSESGTISDVDIKTQYSGIQNAVVLLPIWLSVYTVGAKKYAFMINGQTGKVKGKSPLSALKILIYLLISGGLTAVLYSLFSVYALLFPAIALSILWGIIAGNKD